MSFFKEFKEDLSTAVNELTPGGETDMNLDSVVDDFEQEVAPLSGVESELEKLDGILQSYAEPERKAPTFTVPELKKPSFISNGDIAASKENVNETSIITTGMILTGNLETTSSVEVRGVINGNVQCAGKLIVTGSINGNSSSNEFFADEAKVEGEIVAAGTVKVGAGSVVIGNITATSAVIAGAVKGDIDVKGPVVVDTSAVVMGNIKSRSVQINNGAVIEGFCSQCYSDIDVQGIFG